MSDLTYTYRKAVPEDAPTCVIVRGKTRENAVSVDRLKARGVTVGSWSKGIRDDTLPGYVCLFNDEVIGYCFGSSETGEVVVLALLPEHEDRGIGKKLLGVLIEEFKGRGFKRLFLGCTKVSTARSYGFYCYLGWMSTGKVDAHADEILELVIA